ncbi:MAG TPA: hypothetical protein VM511_05515 [Luteolibacter sp.]|nr:hypothetical protein [Luteolibacter sp.]
MNKFPVRILVPAACFALGMIVQKQISGLPSSAEKEEPSAKPARSGNRETPSTDPSSPTRASARPPADTDPELAGNVEMSEPMLDCILSGRTLEQIISRMGLTGSDAEAVRRVHSEALEDLKRLEITHAKAVSRDGETFVEIQPYAEAIRAWQSKIEKALAPVISKHDARVMARMIELKENDQNASNYRREIHVKTDTPNGVPLIEERTFDKQGQHIDSDFETLDPDPASRWGWIQNVGG